MLDSSYLPGDGQDSCYQQFCASPVAAIFFVFEKVAAIRAEKINPRSYPPQTRGLVCDGHPASVISQESAP
jgi:hypothetical protein